MGATTTADILTVADTLHVNLTQITEALRPMGLISRKRLCTAGRQRAWQGVPTELSPRTPHRWLRPRSRGSVCLRRSDTVVVVADVLAVHRVIQ